jgi:hypothetical protein
MSTFKPGDRVQVAYEGVVAGVNADGSIDYLGAGHHLPKGATVELIERADDPSKDPVGTVRRDPREGNTYIRSDYNDLYPWISFGPMTGVQHHRVVGWEVIGAVPGTPAAEAQKSRNHFE